MGFILDGLETENYDRTYSDRMLVRRVLTYFRPHRKKIAIVALSLFLSSAANAAGPILISRVIDMISGSPKTELILVSALAVIAFGGFGWLCNYIHERLLSEAVGDVVLEVRSDAFKKTVGHDLSFFDENASGKIVSRIASDTQDFASLVSLVTDFSGQFLLVAIMTVWLFFIDYRLTLLLLAMTPLAAGIALSFRRIARKVSLNSKQANAEINSHIQESISGIMIAKTFRKESNLFEMFEKNNRLAYRVGLRKGIILNTIFPVMGIASGCSTALLAFVGGLATTKGHMSPGQWYLFMQAVGFFWWPLLNIASFWSQFQDGLSAAERVFSLVDAEPKVKQCAEARGAANTLHAGASTDFGASVTAADDPHAIAGTAGAGTEKGAGRPEAADSDALDSAGCPYPISSVLGSSKRTSVEFRNLSFSYNDKEHVLDRFNLYIQPGETLAIVGPTGAGKSSIAKLIARFYEFQSGDLLINGTDIRSLELDEYRRRIGYVPQDPFLFTGTVAENIRYGRPEATDEEVAFAASHLGRGDWLDDLPNGLSTSVGERGSSISFGQRQLIALARVLLKDPDLFILDEATASVDPFTEAQIQEGLDAVMNGRTAVVIAHRLSTVKRVHRIIVLDKGVIQEEGTHESLLKSGGRYADLYNTFFRHQSLEYVEQSGKS